MGDLERIEAKVDWCVAALKHLLAEEVGGEWARPPVDEWPIEGNHHVPVEGNGEWIAPRFGPRPPKAKPCPHNQQVLVDGNIACARCGTVLTSSGVQQNRVANDGRVVADPNPPQWATDRSPGASSKNPGTPLVPYSD